MNDLTSALPPNDLRPSAGISMSLHHKTGAAEISKIFYKANIEQTFEMADEIKPEGFQNHNFGERDFLTLPTKNRLK